MIDALTAGGAVVQGSSLKCPFHPDTHPSAEVRAGKDGVWRFRCHAASCGVNGDIHDIRAKFGGISTNDYLSKQRSAEPQSPPKGKFRPKALPKTPPNGRHGQNSGPVVYPDLGTYERFIESKIGALSHAPYRYTNPETGIDDVIVYRIDKPFSGRKKEFRQVSPAPDGKGFIPQAPPKPWPLFNRKGICEHSLIVVCEGEKAALSLDAFGVCATTALAGAGTGKADLADWTPLAGKDVILWPDNDDGGRQHMEAVRDILITMDPPASVSWLEIPGEPEKGDAFDFLAGLGEYSWSERKEILDSYLDRAKPVGPSGAVEAMLEDTIAGRRVAVSWPWRTMGKSTQALLPGTLTMICGKPGSGKSFFILEAMAHWYAEGHKVAVYELEERREYHLNRVLAQVTGEGGFLDTEWVAAHPEETRQLSAANRKYMDAIGARIWDAPATDVTLAQLAEWVEARAKEGCRVIVIDPVTAALTGGRPWEKETEFVNAIKRTAESHGVSIVLVTHPKQSANTKPDQNALAGSAAYSRFSQTILWLEKQHKVKEGICNGGMAPMKREYSHLVHIKKSRNGDGDDTKVAFLFTDFIFDERGFLLKEE